MENAAIANVRDLVLDWNNVQLKVNPDDWPDPRARIRGPRPIVGCLALSAKPRDAGYRATVHEMAHRQDMTLRCLTKDLDAAREWGINHPRVALFTRDEISSARFINSIDFFNGLPACDHWEIFEPFIALALARGAVVFLSPDVCERFGRAAIAAEPDEIPALVKKFVSDRERYLVQSQEAVRYASEHIGWGGQTNPV